MSGLSPTSNCPVDASKYSADGRAPAAIWIVFSSVPVALYCATTPALMRATHRLPAASSASAPCPVTPMSRCQTPSVV